MKAIAIIFSLMFACITVQAQKPGVVISKEPGWHKIGQVSASFKSETESINVLGADVFKAIKLSVKDAPISLTMLKVYYETGESEDIPVNSELQPGEETKVMDVKQKDIKKVAFTYKTVANSKKEKAELVLWGEK